MTVSTHRVPRFDRRQSDRPRVYSLRWKLIGLLLLLTLPLSLLFAELLQNYLLGRYAESRGVVQAQYERQINGLIRQQRSHLEQVAIALPALSHVHESLAKNDLVSLEERFGHFWSAFQLDMGLATAAYLDADGRLLTQWGNEATETRSLFSTPRWKQAFHRLQSQEAPFSFMACVSECRIYALAPVLVQGRLAGSFAIGASLAEMVLTFHATADADIAILTKADDGVTGALAERWGLRLEAGSRRDTSLRLLDELARTVPLATLLRTRTQRLTSTGQTYEIGLIPLATNNDAAGMHVLVLEDISTDLAETERAANGFLLTMLLTLALTVLLISVVLGHHLRRLLRTARAILLLGKGEFHRLRQAIQPRTRTRYHDEIDILDHTAITLSHHLERLENDVEERTRCLQSALREITLEKEFAGNLLEHAEVIIATSDQNGCLLTLNRYGRTLTAYSESDVVGLPLIGSSLLPDASIELYGYLHDIIAGRTQHLRHETSLFSRQGDVSHDISWVHTRLSGKESGEAALLSVGLDISERKQNEQRLHYLRSHDPLTDALNRRGFQDELEKLLDMARRLRLHGALLFVDLDRFKYINDIAGHQAGDQLLISVANTLRDLLADIGSVTEIGRLGGDEFAIAVLNSGTDEAVRLAERILQALTSILSVDAPNYRVTASIGIALFPDQGIDARSLLVDSEIAMYQAKGQKRNGWHLFSPEEKAREKIHDWIEWEERIKQGIAQDHFILFFQPVVRLADGAVSHYEVLLRLRNPDGSLVPPGQFLDVAERAGLIGELDRWVLRNSLQKLASLTDEQGHIALAINLSGASIGDPQLLDELQRLLNSSQIAPERVIFEITETAAIADFKVARTFVETLRQWGCTLALDDFGSGFASFYYLKQFPVDCIKIDGSFIRNLPDNRDDQIFVRAMVEIARAYGKKTVAEFVENDAILALLDEYGVDYAQGYHIGKPAPQLLPATWPAR